MSDYMKTKNYEKANNVHLGFKQVMVGQGEAIVQYITAKKVLRNAKLTKDIADAKAYTSEAGVPGKNEPQRKAHLLLLNLEEHEAVVAAESLVDEAKATLDSHDIPLTYAKWYANFSLALVGDTEIQEAIDYHSAKTAAEKAMRLEVEEMVVGLRQEIVMLRGKIEELENE